MSTAEGYSHEDKNRMRKARLADEGIDEEDNGSDAMERKECGRCGESWPPNQKFCGDCSLALDKDAANEVKELEEARGTVVEEELSGMDREDIVDQMKQLKNRMDNLET